MKLLIIYHCGLSEEAKSFYREFEKQGIDLAVIVPSKIIINKKNTPPGDFTYSQKDDEKEYKFFPVDLRKPNSYGEGFKFFQLFKAIKQAKPDVIHVFDEHTSLCLFQTIFCRNILYGKKVPVLAYVFQNIPFKSPPFIFKFSPRFFKRIIRKILYPLILFYHKKYLSGVTGINRQALENIRALGVNIPMRLIFWGINFSRFYPKDRNLCREKLGIPRDIKLVGNIGRLIKEKGLDKLVKAVSKLSDYYLMIPGRGDYKEELDKLIKSLEMEDRIYRHGNLGYKELVDYYNSLDIFVLATQTTSNCKEQYGMVLIEAMRCQLAIVGSSSGAIPEVLKDYPKHLIFQEDSIDDLVDKIKRVESLKWPDDFDINKFLFKYSVQKFVGDNIEFYRELLNKNLT